MFMHVSLWGVLLAAASAMVIGTIWYSPNLFGTVWMKATGLTDKDMKKNMNFAMPVLVVISLVTAYVLSLLTVYYHAYANGSWIAAGVYTALLAWFGISVTTLIAHGVFEAKRRQLLLVHMGNRLVTLLCMGLILGAFLK